MNKLNFMLDVNYKIGPFESLEDFYDNIHNIDEDSEKLKQYTFEVYAEVLNQLSYDLNDLE